MQNWLTRNKHIYMEFLDGNLTFLDIYEKYLNYIKYDKM